MVAREGAGNLVEGFARTFDPQAFSRSYERSADRAHRAQQLSANRAYEQREWSRRQTVTEGKRAEELKARLGREKKQRRRMEGLARYRSLHGTAQNKGHWDVAAYLEKHREDFIKGDPDALSRHHAVINAPEEGLRAIDIRNVQKRDLRLRREAQNVANRELERGRRMTSAEKAAKFSSATISIDRDWNNVDERSGKGVITDTWIHDYKRRLWADEAKSQILSNKQVTDYNDFMTKLMPGEVLFMRKVPAKNVIPYAVVGSDGKPMRARTWHGLLREPERGWGAWHFKPGTHSSVQAYVNQLAKGVRGQ
ncbi:hypothetical protein CMI37_23170 [Candidatus Pacearchaeota archaeon]|nr:hypothetical protein [Candidatus Pacearchaeota archaeon]